MPTDPLRDSLVESLLSEREGCVRRGLTERVAMIDEQLAAHGATPPAETPEVKPERARPPAKKPRPRKTPGVEKAVDR